MSARKRLTPALALLFLAPATGELFSGSSPPLEFFNPAILFLLCLMYGCGAILVREAVFRWKKGWLAMILLGAAYGIAEEGLAVKSFFDPKWVDIGYLGSYGRWMGINWIWTLELTAFHAVISISVPIILVTMLFWEKREESWVSERGLYLALGGFLFVIALCFFLLTPYRPPAAQYILAMALTVGFVLAAWKMPHPIPWGMLPVLKESGGLLPSVRWFTAFGVMWTVGLFFFSWIFTWLAPAPVTGFMMVLFFLLSGMLLVKRSGNGRTWDAPRQCALASGALGFFLFLAPIIEFGPGAWPNKNAGMTAAAAVMLAFLVWLNRKVARMHMVQSAAGTDAVPYPPPEGAALISPRNTPPRN